MAKNKTALEVNTDSDTSKSMENETDQIADSKLSDKDQINNRADSDSVNNSANGLDKTADNNNASDNGNGYAAEVNDSGKDMTNTVGDNNRADTDNGYTVDIETGEIDRKLTNIEKYNLTLNSAERKEQCRQAGIKSGEARRERKTLGDELKLILSQGDNQNRLCMALFTAALGGNYKAFNSLRDTIGEMPTQKQEVTTNMTEGDRELLENVKKRLNITE